MLRHILFDLALFVDDADRENSQKRILALLQALTYCDQLYIRLNPSTPLIYQSGIQYKVPEQFEASSVPEVDVLRDYLERNGAPATVKAALSAISGMVGGGEHFRDIPRILENGGGDCDNVACWRSAELRELGINAKPMVTWRKRPDGGTTYHVIVRWPDGTAEDPSLLLGMGGLSRLADRQEEVRKLGERTGDVINGAAQAGVRIAGLGAVTTPQNFSSLQYTIPFQTDDRYEDWSPTRPQAFYYNQQYPNLPSTPGGGPIFNTLLGRALGKAALRAKLRSRARRAA